MVSSWSLAHLLVKEPRCKFKSSKAEFFILPFPEGVIKGSKEYDKAVDEILADFDLPGSKEFSGRLELGVIYLRLKGKPSKFHIAPDVIVCDNNGIMNYFFYISQPTL